MADLKKTSVELVDPLVLGNFTPQHDHLVIDREEPTSSSGQSTQTTVCRLHSVGNLEKQTRFRRMDIHEPSTSPSYRRVCNESDGVVVVHSRNENTDKALLAIGNHLFDGQLNFPLEARACPE
ncbi:hypothetical protein P9292_32880 [Caballeronia sp. LZ001]|nr:hypothetical protein [Caballeronia sp. LZ001]MDR5804802.1 hypothetical protein [Caballeronia sp. LZ001]